jgi:hypothetical protein
MHPGRSNLQEFGPSLRCFLRLGLWWPPSKLASEPLYRNEICRMVPWTSVQYARVQRGTFECTSRPSPRRFSATLGRKGAGLAAPTGPHYRVYSIPDSLRTNSSTRLGIQRSAGVATGSSPALEAGHQIIPAKGRKSALRNAVPVVPQPLGPSIRPRSFTDVFSGQAAIVRAARNA